MGRRQLIEGRIVGMHELVFTLDFEGMPLTEAQKDSYRKHVAKLEAQLKRPATPKEGIGETE